MKKILLSVLFFAFLFTGVALADPTYPIVGNNYLAQDENTNYYFVNIQKTSQNAQYCYGTFDDYQISDGPIVHFPGNFYCGANGGAYAGVAYFDIHYGSLGDSGWQKANVWEDGSQFILLTTPQLVFHRQD